MNVIAKRCLPDKAAIERAVYEGVFPRLRGVPLKYYGSVEEEDGSCLWLFLEDVGNEKLDPRSGLQRELAARWLGQVQAAIGPDDLPDFIPIRGAASYQGCLRSILRAVAGLRARSRLDKPSSAFVERIGVQCSALESRWSEIEALSAGVPTVFAHNDCLPKNVLDRRSERGFLNEDQLAGIRLENTTRRIGDERCLFVTGLLGLTADETENQEAGYRKKKEVDRHNASRSAFPRSSPMSGE